MNMRNFAIAIVAAAVLAGCATTASRAPMPPLPPAERAAALARQESREAALAAQPGWSLGGRVALANGSRGGSGRIEWLQHEDRFEVALSAPITHKGWRLRGDAGSAVLEGLDGGPRRGSDPGALLKEATGWDIPVAALGSWVRGARAPAPDAGAAQLRFAADGRLSRLQQDGWTLDYDDWRPQPGGGELPMRISAERDAARIRLVVDDWRTGTDPGP
jgi:outer membrane lipoprotein LolB